MTTPRSCGAPADADAAGDPGGEQAPPAALDMVRAATLARRYLASRRRRAELFAFDRFADPAWDILLDLFAARIEGVGVSVSSACIAANVATSTAAHWIAELEASGLVSRRPDPRDRRRSFLEIAPGAAAAVERWITATFPL